MDLNNVIQVVTFVLGLIGSAGTFWNYFQNRKCYDIKIESSALEPIETGYVLILELQFSNRSRLPLAITEVELQLSEKGEYLPCLRQHSRQFLTARRDSTHLSGLNSDRLVSFPLPLLDLGCASAYLPFVIDGDTPLHFSKPVTLRVHTNRGSADEKRLQLPLSPRLP